MTDAVTGSSCDTGPLRSLVVACANAAVIKSDWWSSRTSPVSGQKKPST